MELFNISLEEIYKLCENARKELYDIFYIETSTKYARELRKNLNLMVKYVGI